LRAKLQGRKGGSVKKGVTLNDLVDYRLLRDVARELEGVGRQSSFYDSIIHPAPA
jgi:hypothetical protein